MEEPRVPRPTMVGCEHWQPERVRSLAHARAPVNVDHVVLLRRHQLKLIKMLCQTGVVKDRYREVRGHRAPEEDGVRPVPQQAVKRVGRRLEGLRPPHGEQQSVGVDQTVKRV